ncbi:hypothetical protein DNTS_004166 [Danionella cerebrum]|uniref:Uncharacterized protein n=1 Tax=Danionella cerebrum TaxID=2873325 RepID=A0A553QRA1_9TELE|nr:hypothetical protein DNTS_004166 [Danionella translucida]
MRASDSKQDSQGCGPVSAPNSSSSLSPTSIPEDVFFCNSPVDKRNFLAESDGCSSEEDLLDLCSSLKDSEYFRDLQLGLTDLPNAQHTVLTVPVPETAPTILVSPVSLPGRECHQCSTKFTTSIQIDLTVGQQETMDRLLAVRSSECQDYSTSDQEEDSDMDSFPTLVRSMSTSRRHSWEFPVSPIDLGRRFSLDTTGIDSDGEREVPCLPKDSHLPLSSFSESSVEETTAVENETPEAQLLETPTKTVYSRSEILATDEKSQADKVSRILETSKKAAREAGEQESEDVLQSGEKRRHVAKRRTSSTDRKEATGNVTWYEFLSIENDEEEEERPERSERGTKVKRTLSSLRNRMTGSFNKDKGKTREKEQHKDKSRNREKEHEKRRRRSVSGHQLVPGSFSSCATCSLCSKTLQRKHGLQCLSESDTCTCAPGLLLHPPGSSCRSASTAAHYTLISQMLAHDFCIN